MYNWDAPNQQSLREIIPQLSQGGQSFQSVVKAIDKLQKKIVDRADSLSKMQVELTKLVETLNNYTQQINLGVESLDDRLVAGISNHSESNTYQLQTIVENIQQYINYLNDTKHTSNKLTEVVENQIKTDKLNDSDFSSLVNSLNKI